jgi:hypothetical protein
MAMEPAKSNLPVTPEALVNMGFDPAENLKDETPDIPMIKTIPQAQMFAMPDDSKVSTVEGVIVGTHRCNAWWDKDNPIDGGRPNCSSLDDIKPLASSPCVQSETCAVCRLNQFGSAIEANGAKGKGKECKNMRRLYLLMDGKEFPYLISLSPTSIKPAKQYLTQLSNRHRHVATVVTKIALEKTTSGSNVYSVAKFSAVKDIDDLGMLAGVAKVKKVVDDIVRSQSQAITGAEYEREEDPFGEPGSKG